MNQNKYILYYILYMDVHSAAVISSQVITEEKQPEGPQQDEIKLEDITTDVGNIEEECKKINCNPIYKVCVGIYKLVCDLLKCFKFKSD